MYQSPNEILILDCFSAWFDSDKMMQDKSILVDVSPVW